MSALAVSMARLPLAVSVFGAQQAWNVFSRPNGRSTETGFYRARAAIGKEFEASPFSYAVQQIGDSIQRSAIDLAGEVLAFRAIRPDRIRDGLLAASRRMLDAARALTPGPNLSATAASIQNIFVVVNLVNRTTAMLNLPPGQIRLAGAVEHAYSFGDYASLWVVEGLGREYADRSWPGSLPPKGLLTTGQAAHLPEKCLLMMHAGMGISFARRIIGELTPYSSRQEIAAAVRRFQSLVDSNARPGYHGPAYESLGLVARTWYPEMVIPVDGELWNGGSPILEYFWHGVGRAIYFNPVYMVPGTTPFEGVCRESPHRLALLNATAGAAWAFAAVNLDRLDIVASLLEEYGDDYCSEQAFSNGFISAVIMAGDSIPYDPHATALCSFDPLTCNAGVGDLWRRVVRIPCGKASGIYLPLLRKHKRLGEVFRYQDLDGLIQRLEGTPN